MGQGLGVGGHTGRGCGRARWPKISASEWTRGWVAVWAAQVVNMVVLGREQYLFRRARGELFRLHISSWKGVSRIQGGDDIVIRLKHICGRYCQAANYIKKLSEIAKSRRGHDQQYFCAKWKTAIAMVLCKRGHRSLSAAGTPSTLAAPPPTAPATTTLATVHSGRSV